MATPEELITALQGEFKEHRASIETLKTTLPQQDAEIKKLGASTTETATKIQDAFKRLDEAQATWTQVVTELKAATTENKELKDRLDKMEAEQKAGGGGWEQGRLKDVKTAGQLFAEKVFAEDRKDLRQALLSGGGNSSMLERISEGFSLTSFEGQPGFMRMGKSFMPGEAKTDTPGLSFGQSQLSGTLVLPYRIPGYVGLPARKLRIRDLMPVLPVTQPSVSFLTQRGFFSVNAQSVTSATAADATVNGVAGSTVTVVTPVAHGYEVFDLILMAGMTGASATNGAFRVLTVADSTHFTYFSPTHVTAGAAAGTITANRMNAWGAAAGVTEGALKPFAGMTFVETVVPVQALAHLVAVTNQIWDDFPGLRSAVDNDLVYGLLRKEEKKLLYGTGVAPDIQGILTLAGVQQYAWSQGLHLDTQIDALRRSLTLVENAELEADGFVVNPFDHEKIETAKGTTGHYLVQYTTTPQGQVDNLWRVPMVVTRAIAAGTALVSAWQTASELREREVVNVKMTDSHADYFAANMLAVRAEERVAAVWKRPEAFVLCTFDSAPA